MSLLNKTEFICCISHVSDDRLVNGLVAPYHGAVAAPVGQVAAKLGLPQQLVEIRHSASHQSELPSLELLEEGADLALAWLKYLFLTRKFALLFAHIRK